MLNINVQPRVELAKHLGHTGLHKPFSILLSDVECSQHHLPGRENGSKSVVVLQERWVFFSRVAINTSN